VLLGFGLTTESWRNVIARHQRFQILPSQRSGPDSGVSHGSGASGVALRGSGEVFWAGQLARSILKSLLFRCGDRGGRDGRRAGSKIV
jgi:hypothetical protein